MKRIRLILLAGVLASLVASAAHAGTHRIDRRQAHQHARIAQGRLSGELTRAELTRLCAGQRRIRGMERRAGSDGIVTRLERRRIERAQDRESRAIWRLKHNDRRRV